MLSEWRIHVLDSQSFPGFLIEAGTANKIGRLPTECNLLVQNEAPSGKGSVSTHHPPPKASPGRLRLGDVVFSRDAIRNTNSSKI